MKKLSAEGRFECGLDEIVKGKVWCFVNVMGEHYGQRLGIAIANESGYTPIPEHWAHADSYREMDEHAEELNRAEGIDVLTAVKIVCSTMGGRFYSPEPKQEEQMVAAMDMGLTPVEARDLI